MEILDFDQCPFVFIYRVKMGRFDINLNMKILGEMLCRINDMKGKKGTF